MMNTRDFLECSDCLKNLEEFIELDGTYHLDAIQALENYTLFLEMKRLKSYQHTVKLPESLRDTQHTFITTPNPFNTSKITC